MACLHLRPKHRRDHPTLPLLHQQTQRSKLPTVEITTKLFSRPKLPHRDHPAYRRLLQLCWLQCCCAVLRWDALCGSESAGRMRRLKLGRCEPLRISERQSSLMCHEYAGMNMYALHACHCSCFCDESLPQSSLQCMPALTHEPGVADC